MKKIAIIAHKLNMGGTEKSLINLLNIINKKYDITLYLLKKEGILLNQLPTDIKIKEIFSSSEMKYIDSIREKKFNIRLFKVIALKLLNKINMTTFYKYLSKYSKKYSEIYDWCIDFHGYGYYGSYYAIKYINAANKVTFIHDENVTWAFKIKKVIKKFDYYFCVSNACKKAIKEQLKIEEDKIKICRNIINKENVVSLSNEKQKINYNDNEINLLTIGRLEFQKGYDLLIKIVKILKIKKIKFHWYVIGGGSLEKKLKAIVNDEQLENYITFLGTVENPYPYIKNCDLYVQTSRHEGYGIAIAEARILNKPIVSTNLECVKEQIVDGYNGVLCEFDENIFSNNIINLIKNEKIREYLIENLKKENDNDSYDFINIIGE